MVIAALCDHSGNCRYFGPFTSTMAARDWAMEAQELGFLPHAAFTVSFVEEPVDLGFDPGL